MDFSNFISGGCAGAGGILCTQPIDTIKTRLIAQPSNSKIYNGIFDCALKTVRGEGFRGLWKGVGSPIVTQIFFNSIIFFSYENTINYLEKDYYFKSEKNYRNNGDSNYLNVSIGGLVAGLVAPFMSTPQERVKNIAQMNIKNNGNIREEWIIAKDLFGRGFFGNQGINRGFALTSLRDACSYVMFFVAYEWVYRMLGKTDMASFHAGGFAGVIAWTSIYPLECLKTRWQITDASLHKQILPFWKLQIQNDGYKYLVQGYSAMFWRAYLQSAIIFFTHAGIQKYFFQPRKDPETMK